MSRTIQLTKLHALNWYGYRESIDVRGNLLLAGVTGSGKSILMDLIQIVLVGDQRLVRFNQSATGDRSDRNLKSYCLGDTKQEENGITQYMRNSAVSYVALEFTWPNGKKVETWGLRIEFTSAAQSQGSITPLLIPRSLNRSDFLSEPNEKGEKFPLDATEFKARVESWKGRLYVEGLDAYLRDMAQAPHLNFDRAILRSLLPSAMSFTFLKSFNEFCRHFILPSDKLNVEDVRDSYRTFLGYERELNLLNDQFQKLKSISESYTRLSDLRRDRAVARYLEAELRHEHASEQLTANETKLAALKKDFASEESRLGELDEQIPKVQANIDAIKASIYATPEGQLYGFIKSRIKEVNQEIQSLRDIGTTLDQALAARLRRARGWLKQLRALPLELDAAQVEAVDVAIAAVEKGGVARAGETLGSLNSAAQQAASNAVKAANADLRRLTEIRQQLGQLRDEIRALEMGRLPFPTRLLDALNNHLLSRDGELAAQPLCKLCEVTDERWRPAIEIAFTRKFAVVVDAENYEQAEKIYHGLKASDLGTDLGRESLINPAKALKARKQIRPGSLAEKIKTNHPVAEAVVSQLFGDVICVERREQLRDHDFAILPDGFRSSGAFVERPRFYDGNPFVGKEGLKQQLAWKEKQRAELEIEARRLQPLEEAVRSLNDGWREHFDITPNLYQDLARVQALPKLEAELAESIAKLNQIDRAEFDQLAKKQSEAETLLATLAQEQRELLQSPKRRDLQHLEAALVGERERVAELAEKFERVKSETDISPWFKRLQQLRCEMLAVYPAKEAAADKFNSQYHQHDRNEAETWQDLLAKRRELALIHPKFDDLPVESDKNDSYDKQLAKLNESDIPDYKEKAERERKHWEGLFRDQVLDKLNGALQSVKDLLFILNQELRKRPIGTHRYELHYRQNPDFKIWHELVEASNLARENELFFASADQRFRDAISLFLKTLIEQPDSIEATRLLDYRHYFEYDMEVIEQDGRKTSVDRQSGKFSGGENQSPYFIAILASYLRAYRRYSSRKQEPTLGLVPIDEAFSKLSGERIKDCISALKTFDLQGVFSMSTGNIPYAFDHCDWLIVVSKHERRIGKKVIIDNIPVSLARASEEANRIMHRE